MKGSSGASQASADRTVLARPNPPGRSTTRRRLETHRLTDGDSRLRHNARIARSVLATVSSQDPMNLQWATAMALYYAARTEWGLAASEMQANRAAVVVLDRPRMPVLSREIARIRRRPDFWYVREQVLRKLAQ
jgi:hypothetical protein